MKLISCDILVVGAGPAGTTAARVLAQEGVDVILLDKTILTKPKIGESLPGAINPLLKAIGVYPWFLKSKPLRNYGNISVWGMDKPIETDFINDPYGCGWHVDRSLFELSLREAAIDANAHFIHKSIISVNATNYGIEINAGDCTIRARWVIDASGRSRVVAGRLGGIVLKGPPLLSLYTWHSNYHLDTRSIVEAVPNGWWYSAGLPEDKRVLALHISPKDAKRYRQPASFITHLNKTQYMLKYFEDYKICDVRVHVADATESHMVKVSGANWVAIGDAALSFDPLSSQGIYNAIYTGLRGAQAVLKILNDNDRTLLMEYESRILSIYNTYKDEIRSYYRNEQRWPKNFFWDTQHNSIN
ncbi:flavin-dependent dehydrogenase [Rahnella sp. JUb53]|uniref:NAD(P)/FAD-dependent oxidoreductase n=1 Tax=Rahnella sp. JUb53 TaxID=2485128 RepID=UPI0010531589|nr:NAD(P)/FAD-dependent oxidoreductase [Rahnella sp. JUb53]TCQ83109.1 flavin-dependent dehydrogenase [Rahnella sp. JUb53]